MADDLQPGQAGYVDPTEAAISQYLNRGFGTDPQTSSADTGQLQQPPPPQNLPQVQNNVYTPPQGPPQMGGVPLIAQYLQGMIKGPQRGLQPAGTPNPGRGDMTLQFLGQFLANMSAGLAAGGHGPGSNERAAGAAMQAPYQRSLTQYQLGQQQQAQQAQIAAEQAKTEQTQAQTKLMGSQVMTPYGPMSEKLAEKVFPAAVRAGGAVDVARINQGVLANVPQELQDKYGVPAQLPISKVKALMAAEGGQYQVVQGADDQYMLSKVTGSKQGLGLGNPRVAMVQMRPVQVADPASPGNTKWVTASEAIQKGMAGPSSASIQVPRKVMDWATTGKGGEEINAFNTAMQHADLLEKAAVAMHNGDIKALNSLSNRFKTEFGSADVTNFQTIANAYTREVTKMLSAGHITDAEIKDQGATLPANASPEQLYGSIMAYRALATSKMNMRYDQYQQGLQGKPNFPNKGNQDVLDKLAKKYLKK